MPRPKKEGMKRRVTLGWGKDGKQVRKWIYGKNEKELLRLEDQEREQFERLKRAGVQSTKFGPYAEHWIRSAKSGLQAATISMYENSLTRCSRFEFRELQGITRTELQDFINTLTPSCATKTNLLLRGVFFAAVADGIIAVNPMAAPLSLPKPPEKTDDEQREDEEELRVKRAFYPEEREKIKSAKLKPADRAFLDIMYFFGTRRSEALALTPADFDFEKKQLRITKALSFGPGGQAPYIKGTKTGVSRYVPIPAQAAERIRGYLEQFDPGDYLFTRQAGGLMTLSAFRRMWGRIETAIEMPITSHYLRHDFCSRLAYAKFENVSVQKRAQLCGHSYETYVRVYLHVDETLESLADYDDKMPF